MNSLHFPSLLIVPTSGTNCLVTSVLVRYTAVQQNISKPNEIEYADDVDFVGTKKYVDLDLDLDKITPTLKKYKLIINTDKTEYVQLKRDTVRKKETWGEKKTNRHLDRCLKT